MEELERMMTERRRYKRKRGAWQQIAYESTGISPDGRPPWCRGCAWWHAMSKGGCLVFMSRLDCWWDEGECEAPFYLASAQARDDDITRKVPETPEEWTPIATVYRLPDDSEGERYRLVLAGGTEGQFPRGVYGHVFVMHLLADVLAEATREMWESAEALMKREQEDVVDAGQGSASQGQ